MKQKPMVCPSMQLASLSPYLSLLSMVEPIDKCHPGESGLVHKTNLVQGLAIGSKSPNKVSVGELAEGSLTNPSRCRHIEATVKHRV